MRKQLHEIEGIERYIFNTLSEPDRLLFEVKMIANPELKANMLAQHQTYSLIRLFGRKKKKEQLEAMHFRIMEDKKFSAEITSIFR